MDVRQSRYKYISIIKNAIKENRKKQEGTYYENHHILPKSIFPLWKYRKRNQVLLTAAEHFRCHELLVDIYPSKGMTYALWGLVHDKEHYHVDSDTYEKIRVQHSKNVSELMKKYMKEHNPMKGKKRTFMS